MSKLRDLVLSVAPEGAPSPEGLSPTEVVASRQPYSLLEAVDLVRWAQDSISQDPQRAWECISLVTAVSFRAPFRSSDTRRVLLLLAAKEVTYGNLDGLSEILEALQKEEQYLLQEQQRARRRAVVGSAVQALDYLQDVWGDDFVQEASEVLGYKKQTIKRWLDGGGISADAAGRLLLWARAFYGLPDGSEKRWWQSPLLCGTTPREYFCAGWTTSPPGTLRVSLQEIDGADY